MNKIQITAEQAKAIQARLDIQSAEALINIHATPHAWTAEDALALNSLSVAELAKALYVGYEIEQPKINAGDWVTRIREASNEPSNFRVGVTFQVNRTTSITAVDNSEKYHAISSLRHATPQEIFWAELNRPDNFFKIGDVLVTENGHTFSIVEDWESLQLRTCYMNDAINMLDADAITVIYPVEARKEVPKNASC